MLLEQLLPVLSAFAAVKNPKIELNYILADGENLVATDTRALLIIPYEVGEGPLLLSTGKSTGYSATGIFRGVPFAKDGKYLDYKRIQNKEPATVYSCEGIQEALLLYPYLAGSDRAVIDVLALGTRIKKLQSITKWVEVVKVSYSGGPVTLKLTLLDGETAELIVMPLILRPDAA